MSFEGLAYVYPGIIERQDNDETLDLADGDLATVRGTYRRWRVVVGFAPDIQGLNIAGILRAHRAKHGSHTSFDFNFPQDPETVLPPETLRVNKTDQGASIVKLRSPATTVHIPLGIFVQFGDYLYCVQDKTDNTITLDWPLKSDVASLTEINFAPVVKAKHDPDALNQTRYDARGVYRDQLAVIVS